MNWLRRLWARYKAGIAIRTSTTSTWATLSTHPCPVRPLMSGMHAWHNGEKTTLSQNTSRSGTRGTDHEEEEEEVVHHHEKEQ